MAGWTELKNLIDSEQTQLIEEGIEPAAAREAAAKARSLLDGRKS